MNYRFSNIVHACGLAKEQLCLIYTETQTEEKNDKTIRRSPFALLHRTTHHELQILEIFHAGGIAKEQLCFIDTEKQTEGKDGDHGQAQPLSSNSFKSKSKPGNTYNEQ